MSRKEGYLYPAGTSVYVKGRKDGIKYYRDELHRPERKMRQKRSYDLYIL